MGLLLLLCTKSISLSSAYLRVGHPAAWLDLIRIESPVFQLFFKERSAHIRRVMELAGAVIVQNLSKYAWVTIEEIFVEHGIVVAQILRQPGQSGGWDLLEGGLVGLVTHATAIEDAAVFSIHCG